MTDHDWSLPHVAAHRHSDHHREELERSDSCGCFHCLKIFPCGEIGDWLNAREAAQMTARCPNCGIDSVIGSASGYPIERSFLERMRDYWFAAR